MISTLKIIYFLATPTIGDSSILRNPCSCERKAPKSRHLEKTFAYEKVGESQTSEILSSSSKKYNINLKEKTVKIPKSHSCVSLFLVENNFLT